MTGYISNIAHTVMTGKAVKQMKKMEQGKMQQIELQQIKVEDDFWSARQQLVTDVVIPYQERILSDQVEGVKKSHAFANFRIAAGLENGEFYGMEFQDSDVAKWLEAVAYALIIKPDPALEKRADEVIDTIFKAQWEDGYLNTYFTVKAPGKRWTNLGEGHELYCAGHMMEAAVAYSKATGKNKLLEAAERLAEHIENHFLTHEHKGIPGHQEVEIGLMKMYHLTKKENYRKLAMHFLDERGKDPLYFKCERKQRGWSLREEDHSTNNKYNQSNLPVREQKTAEGHSVRAVYMYTAMADLAAQTNDEGLYNACRALWENVVQRRMYITGGIGSTAEGESFTIDYDLPNDSAYAETCASVGLVFWARNMLDIHQSSEYADVMERALYNGILGGMQLDGQRFFYVNPLEVNPDISGELYGFRHVLPERPGWYDCACCPPNVARLLTSLGKYAWGESLDTIFSHLFLGGTACLHLADIKVESRMPWTGEVTYRISPHVNRFSLAIRIPAYADNTSILINGEETRNSIETLNGYAFLNREWREGDEVAIRFSMPVRRIHCNTLVRENIGRVALMRGPLVYCFEEKDNGRQLQELHIPASAAIEVETGAKDLPGGIISLRMKGKRISRHDTLYYEGEQKCEDVELSAIPYYAWGNRGINQMSVWMHETL